MKRWLGLRGQFATGLAVQLVLLCGGLAFFLQGGGDGPAGPWLTAMAARRVNATAATLAGELRRTPRADWDDVLADYGRSHGAAFALLRRDGTAVAGTAPVPLPAEILGRLPPPRMPTAAPPGRPPHGGVGEPPGPGLRRPPPGDPPSRRPPPGAAGRPDEPVFLFFTRAGEPPRHYAAVLLPRGGGPRAPLPLPDPVLLIAADRLGESPLFFDWRPWLAAAAGLFGLSFLIWTPMLQSVIRRLRALGRAAARVADGDFDLAIHDHGRDEISRLGRAVETMARRLDDRIAGQRRFLADTAHELCAPLARLRMSAGLLARDCPPEAAARVAAVEEEIEELSQLVGAILEFSKANIQASAAPSRAIDLAALAADMAAREAPGCDCRLAVPGDLEFTADPDALRRALGNLLRNAAAHGRPPVEISAGRGDGTVWIRVADHGDGVPADWLPHLFEPFSRPDPARTREQGGHGLGLAIARACAQRLGGTLSAANRPGGGLVLTLELPDAPAAAGSN
jgi:two-component system, OmpR family, sensor histidine kinase CpxA